MKVFLTFFIIFPICFSLISQQDDWTLKKNKQGIQIYTRTVGNSKFKEFKAITQVKANVTTLVAVMKDTTAYKELFPLTIEMHLLEEKGETYQVQYVKTDVPFPVTDRDGIYEFQYRYDRQEK